MDCVLIVCSYGRDEKGWASRATHMRKTFLNFWTTNFIYCYEEDQCAKVSRKTSLEKFEPFDFIDCEIEKTDGV